MKSFSSSLQPKEKCVLYCFYDTAECFIVHRRYAPLSTSERYCFIDCIVFSRYSRNVRVTSLAGIDVSDDASACADGYNTLCNNVTHWSIVGFIGDTSKN